MSARASLRPARAPGFRIAAFAAMVFLSSSAAALAADEPASRLEAARAAYARAMAEGDRDRRVAAFAEASALLGALAAAHPRSPEIQADWGNAALGAGELGAAVLAYRRALLLDPGHPRATRNLAWARERLPRGLPVPGARGALDSLFFWHHALSFQERLLGSGLAFAAAVLLLAPWRRSTNGGRAAPLHALALIPAIVWLGFAVSALLEPDARGHAVLTAEEAVLRAADSHGAPAVLGRPLTAGLEVEIIEERPPFVRVELADGTRGWVASSAIERIKP